MISEGTVVDRSEGVADRRHLCGARVRSGNEVPLFVEVTVEARCGETERAVAKRLLGNRRHLRHIFRRRIVVATIAHHVVAHRDVWNLRTDIDRVRRVDRIEILTVGLPTPRNALMKCCTGNVLDALHQLDQLGLTARVDGREPHTAVPHDDRGDPVPAARGHVLVPTHLAVVVGMNVDKPGRDHLPMASISRLAPPSTFPTATIRPRVMAISPENASPPVPSTIWAWRRIRSYIAGSLVDGFFHPSIAGSRERTRSGIFDAEEIFMLDGIHHVSINVSDVQAAQEFYENVLGLERLKRPDFRFDGAWLRSGQQEVHLIGIDSGPPVKEQHFGFPGREPCGGARGPRSRGALMLRDQRDLGRVPTGIHPGSQRQPHRVQPALVGTFFRMNRLFVPPLGSRRVAARL